MFIFEILDWERLISAHGIQLNALVFQTCGHAAVKPSIFENFNKPMFTS